VVGVAQGKTVN